MYLAPQKFTRGSLAMRSEENYPFIYYHDNKQKGLAEVVIEELASYYQDPIVTELTELDVFYKAEKEHQDYYRNNKTQGYCSFVITPKLARLRQLHTDKLK